MSRIEHALSRASCLTLSQEIVKRAFKILRDTPQVDALLTRDSVCAGDDCDAPHERTISVPSFVDPDAFAREVSADYLPTVAGIGHSWTCVLNEIKIAEIRTDGTTALVRETPFRERNKIHFIYHSATY